MIYVSLIVHNQKKKKKKKFKYDYLYPHLLHKNYNFSICFSIQFFLHPSLVTSF